MRKHKPQLARIIAVMGPTAAGKTALAVELAQRWNGEIISVDSALVYCGLDIGAAKPTVDEQAGIAHHLLNIRQPWQCYSAAEFATDAAAAIQAITARGKLPILVGGTGLYFRALLQGLSALPAADPQVRAAIHAQAQALGWPYLHAQLQQVDPAAAQRIKPQDTQRITRALEVFRLTGQTLSDWQAQPTISMLPLQVLKLVIAPTERAWLHQRISQRFERMLQQGFLDEVCRLRAQPEMQALADPLQLPAIRAVGYRQAWQFLDGDHDVATFQENALAATRQLAKRQMTWLRREENAQWFDAANCDLLRMYDTVARFLER